MLRISRALHALAERVWRKKNGRAKRKGKEKKKRGGKKVPMWGLNPRPPTSSYPLRVQLHIPYHKSQSDLATLAAIAPLTKLVQVISTGVSRIIEGLDNKGPLYLCNLVMVVIITNHYYYNVFHTHHESYGPARIHCCIIIGDTQRARLLSDLALSYYWATT